MGFWSKLFNKSGPGEDEKVLIAIRDAICEPGDTTARLAGLLELRPDLNRPPAKPGFPILLTMGMMISDYNAAFPIALAALLHKPERLRLLLRHDAGTEVKCAHGRTALHWAIAGEEDSRLVLAAAGEVNQPERPLSKPLPGVPPDVQTASIEVTRILLDAGANPNASDPLGNTPLHRACSFGGKTEHMSLLLQRGASVSAKTGLGITPLIMAVQNELAEAVELLLEAGADPNARSTSPAIDALRAAAPDAGTEIKGTAALHWACARGCGEIARLLIKAGADVNARDNDGNAPVEIAVACGSLALVEILQKAGAQLPSGVGWRQTLLLEAMRKGDTEGIAPLLAQLDIKQADANGMTLLHHAIAVNASQQAVSLLIDHGADIEAADAEGRRAIGFAAAFGADKTIELLHKRGVDLKAAAHGGWQPLHVAAGCGKANAVTALLKAGADPNALDESGFTPLARAVIEGHIDAVKAFIAGMPPDSTLAELPGFSPLVIAAKTGQKPLVELILSRQPNLEAKTSDGWTALHEAVVHGPELTRLLLERGANANASTLMGYTPLHRAAGKGLRDVVVLLVQHGADIRARDAMGTGAGEFARDSGDSSTFDVVSKLLNASP